MNDGRGIAALMAALLLVICGCGRSGDSGSVGSAPVKVTAAVELPEANPTAAAGVADGTIRGRVVFDGPAPGRQKLQVVKDVAVCSKINHLDDRLVVGEGGGIRYAVVSLRGVSGGKAITSMGSRFELDQKTCAYSPHVVLLPAGSPLTILNGDDVLHNIHSFSKLNKPFNIAQPKVLREIERTFETPEKIPVRCDVHGWMCAWVIVVDHPYHAVTGADGGFEIAGIPPGRYTLECWQEELGEQSAEIVVGAGAGGSGGAEHRFVYRGKPSTAIIN